MLDELTIEQLEAELLAIYAPQPTPPVWMRQAVKVAVAEIQESAIHQSPEPHQEDAPLA